MSMQEGSRRMQSAGKKITTISFIALALVLCLAIANSYLDGLWGGGQGHAIRIVLSLLSVSIPVFLFLLVIGAALWLAGWIVAGFSESRSS